jgi:hypothetical protein
MALMDEQYFSQTFRRAHPKFNGLIWAYHWLQVGLYEPFIEGRTEAERKAGVQATLARFWSMLEDPTSRMPKVMPMTSAVAPRFSAAHPRAAVIFDNLHMTHDIISDILTADTIPHDKKGEMIADQLDKFQDPTRDVISLDEWRMMADHMGGIGAMGGPAAGLVGLVQAPATPAPEAGQMRGAMPEMAADSGRMAHDMGKMDPSIKGMAHDSTPPAHKADTMLAPMPAHMSDAHIAAMMDLHARMTADPVIRQRIMADSVMRRLMTQMMDSAGAGRIKKPSRTKKHERPTAPKPRRAKPEPADTTPHDQHSMGSVTGRGRTTEL